MSQPPPSHKPRTLLAEMDARIKVRDIREWERLKRQVEIKWWESGLVALLFVSGVTVLVTVAKLAPGHNEVLYAFVLGWCGLFVLTLIGCIEFLVLKFRALRRMHEETARHYEELHTSLKAIRDYLEAREEADRERGP
ncbi:MAG: hypothetical protein KF858_09960 [Candidatus Sumerlaeia bacterium]|nr:hypothetical protein [Candidatus Sumerlaeia bacterium]